MTRASKLIGFKSHKGEIPLKNFRLARARIEKDLTGDKIASLVGVPTPTFYSYENLRRYPPTQVQEKIAKILGKSRKFLFPKNIKRYYKEKNRNSQDIYDRYNRVDSFDFGNMLSDYGNPEKSIEEKEFEKVFFDLVEEFKPVVKEIFKLRYDNSGEMIHTLEEIADIKNYTLEGIRQINLEIMGKLKWPERAKRLLIFSTDEYLAFGLPRDLETLHQEYIDSCIYLKYQRDFEKTQIIPKSK